MEEVIRIYLDDVRPAPEGWRLARTVDHALGILSSMREHQRFELSLDFDLGMTTDDCPSCDNRGWGRFDAPDHPDYCPDCSHKIVTHNETEPTGDKLLVRLMKLQDEDHDPAWNSDWHPNWLPDKIYLHTANPVGRSTMRWLVMDMQDKYGVSYPEAFR